MKKLDVTAVIGAIQTPTSELQTRYSDAKSDVFLLRRRLLVESSGLDGRELEAAAGEFVRAHAELLKPATLELLEKIVATQPLAANCCGTGPDPKALYEARVKDDRDRQAAINQRFTEAQLFEAAVAKLDSLADDEVLEAGLRVLPDETLNALDVTRESVVEAILTLDTPELARALDEIEKLFPAQPPTQPSPKKEVPVFETTAQKVARKEATVLIEKVRTLESRLGFCPYVVYGWDLNHEGQPVFRGDGYSYLFAGRNDTQIIAFHIDKEVFRDGKTDRLVKKSLYLSDVERNRRLAMAVKLIRDSATTFATWDDGKLIVYRDLTGRGRWMGPFMESSINFRVKRKTMKRTQSLAAPYLLTARFRVDELKVKFILDTDSRLEDGWMQISDLTYARCLEQYRGYPGHILRNERHYERLKVAKIHSFRMVIPSTCNRELLPDGGMAKGHCSIVPAHKMGGYDVIIHLKANVKNEVVCHGSEFILGFNPQCDSGPANTNLQYLINYKDTLFSAKEVRSWVRNYLDKIRYMFSTGLPVENAADFARQKANDEDNSEEDQMFDSSILMRMRWNAFQVCYNGERVHRFPYLTSQIWKAYTGLLFTKNKFGEKTADIHVEIPCSRFAQVIGQTAARRSGYDLTVPVGEISWWEELGVSVVSDETWLKMIKNHGGCDKDDKFTHIYREVGGVKGVFILRSPNAIGEWSFLKAMSTEDCPASTKYDFTGSSPKAIEYTWPTVDFTLDQMPPQSSTFPEKAPLEPAPFEDEWGNYTKEFVADKLLVASNNGATGNYPNSLMLFSLLFGKASTSSPCTLEEAIDWMTQMSDPAIARKILKWAKDVTDFVVAKKLPVDRLFANQFPKTVRSQMNLTDGHFVALHDEIEKDIAKALKWVEVTCPWEMPHCVARTIQVTKEDILGAETAFQWFLDHRREYEGKEWDTLKQKVYDLVKVDCPIRTLKRFHIFARLVYKDKAMAKIDYILMSNPSGPNGKEVEGMWTLFRQLLECRGVHSTTPSETKTPEMPETETSTDDWGTSEETAPAKIVSVIDEMEALLG